MRRRGRREFAANPTLLATCQSAIGIYSLKLHPLDRYNIGGTIIIITFDPAKRALTLDHRGLDFARPAEVFAGLTASIVDERFDYDETRFITAGHLDGRLVVIVWTQRQSARHIISMRHCHAKEEKLRKNRMEGFG